MGPGRDGRRTPGAGSAGALAAAILSRIADGDLPAGLELEPARIAAMFEVSAEIAALALERLEESGATVRIGDSWMVRTDRIPAGREMLNRVGPLLRSMVSLAEARRDPAQAAGLLAAYDRFAGLAGDGTKASRTEGYRLFMRRLADASGSSFHVVAVDAMLSEAAGLLDRAVAHKMQHAASGDAEDALARLARGLMSGDSAAISEAVDDHLIIIGRHLDCAAAG